MPSLIEIDAALVPANEIEKVRGFAASLEDSQLRDVLMSLTVSVSGGQDVALFELDAEFTPSQVAKRLRMSRTHLYALLDSGEIPFHRVGRDRRVRASDMINFELRRQESRRELAEKFAHADMIRKSAIDELAAELDD